ncbi:MAG: transposase, partial [Kiritimatiellae bacterium]|nr:transposase [Kiritimatiellia bacterium]
VFGDREPRGVLVTDRYTGYDKPWRGDRQYCFAHILRKLLQLQRKDPDNPEYKAFVPQMAELLAAAMTLRSKGLPPEAFAREARSTRSKIAELAGRSARDPELQKVQNIFREHPDRVYHWARGPDIPAENNRAERGVRGLVIARKTSFGGQSEEALRVREVNQSVMETLALRCDDPAAKLAQALDIYASTGKKSAVRDFLFPKAGRLDCAQHQAQR